MELFSGSTQKQIVGIAVTPNIGLEVMLIDKKTNKVTKYGRRPLEYNNSAREIQDYQAFKGHVIDLFNELEINIKSNVFVVLPNVHFGFISLPLIINDEAISNALLAKAEESYIFKRVEPVSAWMDVNLKSRTDNRYLVYSSFQKTAIEEIQDIFQEIGSNLVGIETSYAAFLRGIVQVGIAKEEIQEGLAWNILLVNSNSYALFSLSGDRLIEYTEVPLAIKSFSYEEAYQAISSSVAQVLPNHPARKLLIVSQTDDICAEVLQTQISFEEEVSALDCNKYTKKSFAQTTNAISPEEARYISLSAVGAATYQPSETQFALNVLGKGSGSSTYVTFELFGKEVLLTPELIQKTSMSLFVGLGIVFVLLYFGLDFLTKRVTEHNANVTSEVDSIKAETAKLRGEGGVININALISKINSNNKKTISFYDSLASDIPKNIWLTYYYNQDGDKVAIEGLSSDINDIYVYYNSLKVISPSSSIKLNKLKVITDVLNNSYDWNSDTDIKLYDFEISNVTSPKTEDAKKTLNAPQPGQEQPGGNIAPPPPTLPALEPISNDDFTN